MFDLVGIAWGSYFDLEWLDSDYVAPLLREPTVPMQPYLYPHPRQWYEPIEDEL